MNTQNISSEILMIVHDGDVVPKIGTTNEDNYNYWNDLDEKFYYFVTTTEMPAFKSKCILITEENKDQYPEYFI